MIEPLAAALLAAAVAELRPASPLRVAALVDRSTPALLDPYLRAGCLARRVEVSSEETTRLRRTPARPYHDVCRLVPGASLESAGVLDASLDLALVGPSGIPWLGEVVASLAEGGVLVIGDEPSARAALLEIGAQASSVAVDGAQVLMLRRGGAGRRAGGSTTPPWSTLDRCACVDRRRVAAAIACAHPPRRSLDPSDHGEARGASSRGAEAALGWARIQERLARAVASRLEDPELGAALLEDVAGLMATCERAAADGAADVRSPSASDRAGVDLLLLVPHPDDETVYFGGVVAAAIGAGLRLHVATLTGGEGGLDLRGVGPAAPLSARAGDGVVAVAPSRGTAEPAPPLGLAEARALEQSAALEALGAGSCGRTGLGFADTGKYVDGRRSRPMSASEALARWDLAVIIDRLVDLFREVRPRVIVTMDPIRDPNYSLHAHHLACGAAALVAAGLSASDEGGEGSLAGLWTVQPSHVAADVRAAGDRATETDTLGLAQIPVEIGRKLAALAAYPSQGYSTQRLVEALEAAQATDREICEVLLRRVRFSPAADPIQLLPRTDGRCA